MSSHYEWEVVVLQKHNEEKPFSPENGQTLKFKVGDPVIYTNDYGVSFALRVTGLYLPKQPCCLYATGSRYLLDKSSYWMPVSEDCLRSDESRVKQS